MTQIIPAIIGQSFREVSEKAAQVEKLVEWVQIDVVDGKFAKPATWNNPEDLKLLTGRVKIEAHLMTEYPEENLRAWMEVADRLIVHAEATDHLAEILDTLHGSLVESGVALLMETDSSVIAPHLEQIDLVQLMTIDEIGEYGHAFSSRAVERIRAVRTTFPNVKISVDGGINLETGKLAIEAGADNLVVGSAIWESLDLNETIKKFKNL